MMNNSIVLEVRNVSYVLGHHRILEDINFTVNKGEIITIIGPNGGGKSTLAKLIVGIIKPSGGVIVHQDNTSIGYIPQKFKTDKVIPITVERFLSLNESSATLDPYLLKQLNIKNILDYNLSSLSGGQLQKVLIFQALCKNPQLIILDEPIQGLDIESQIEFYKLIENLNIGSQISIVIISHDLNTVMRKAKKIICLNKHICCRGTPEDVISDPTFTKLFGFESYSAIGKYLHKHDHNHLDK